MTSALATDQLSPPDSLVGVLQAGTRGVGSDSDSIRTGINKVFAEWESRNLATSSAVKTADLQANVPLLHLQVLSELAKFGQYIEFSWRKNIINRLNELLDPNDWDNGVPLPSIESFRTFLRLAVYVNPSRRPGLAIAPNGNFVAIWVNNEDRMFIETRAKDRMKWVLSKRAEGSSEIASGETKVHRVLEVTQPYDPENFFDNEK
jgi:hypothetical protein